MTTQPWESELLRLAENIRIPSQGPFNALATATSLGLNVVRGDFGPRLWGSTNHQNRVAVSDALKPSDQSFVLAHEIGHCLIRRNAVVLPGGETEWFCDLFAVELVLPQTFLGSQRAPDLTRLQRSYAVPGWILYLQLARSGRISPITRLRDGTLLCAVCGIRPHAPGCGCLPYRQDTGLPLTLPQEHITAT